MSSQTIQQIIWYVSVGANVLPVLIGIWAWRDLTTPLKLIWGTFILSLVLAASSITIALLGGNTHWLFYAGPIGYGILFGLAYWLLLRSRFGQAISLATVLLPALLALLLIATEGVKLLNLYAYALLDGMLVLITLSWFNEQMHGPGYRSLRSDPWFWVNLSTLLYWGYGLITSFVEGALFGYNEQLFNFIFFGLSPFMQFLNVGLICIGFWRLKMNRLSLISNTN